MTEETIMSSISREVERVALAMAEVIARRHGNNRAEDWLNDQRREEARAAIAALSPDERLIEALTFYRDEWEQDVDAELTAYSWTGSIGEVTPTEALWRDRGKKAREALLTTKADQ